MNRFWGYVHPGFQIGVIGLGAFVLILGLRLRRYRKATVGPESARLAGRHIRLARWLTGMYTAGYFLGLAGIWFALEEKPFRTAHSYFGTLTLLLLWGTAYLGRRLRLRPENGDIRQLHSYCAFLACFLTLAVAFLGMNLLP